MIDSNDLAVRRGRMRQLFEFLQAMDQVRNPVTRLLRDQLWSIRLSDIPDHPSIWITPPPDDSLTVDLPDDDEILALATADDDADDIDDEVPDVILRVQLTRATNCPPPPPALANWIERGYDDPETDAIVREALLDEVTGDTKLFVEYPNLQQLLDEWRLERSIWAGPERLARQAIAFYDTLYQRHAEFEREGESVELVLGDGQLFWRREPAIDHPVLLQRVELQFDPEQQVFSVVEATSPPELYSALFSESEVAPAVAAALSDLRRHQYHPLGISATSGFLTALAARLSSQGRLLTEAAELDRTSTSPQIIRDPVLFMRRRSLGYATAIESILKDIETCVSFPDALLSLCGFETLATDNEEQSDGTVDSVSGNESSDILLSKLANPEQVEIGRRLERHKAALVQGPPGTGKTHTIGNLVGHFLAQGKKILVTSHTSKALRVLHHQVVDELKPLCVNLLASDSESQELLDRSVQGIVERLSSDDATALEAQAVLLAKERAECLEALAEKRRVLASARAAEYLDITHGDASWTPSEAARFVADHQAQDDWLPGPLTPGAVIPLTEGDVQQLYRTNCSLSNADERELTSKLPSLAELLSPSQFRALVERRDTLESFDRNLGKDLWAHAKQPDVDRLEETMAQCQEAAEVLSPEPAWRAACIEAGHREQTAPWCELIELVEATQAIAAAEEALIIRHDPVLTDDYDFTALSSLVERIHERNQIPKSLEFLTHTKWRAIRDRSTCRGKAPNLVEHFEALFALACVERARTELVDRWDRLLGPLGEPTGGSLGRQPELYCRQRIAEINRWLQWHSDTWLPIQAHLESEGFLWDTFFSQVPAQLGDFPNVTRLGVAVGVHLAPVLAAKVGAVQLARVTSQLSDYESRVESMRGREGSAGALLNELIRAVHDRDVIGYEQTYGALANLLSKNEDFASRKRLLDSLDHVAPVWAQSIRNRVDRHGQAIPPGSAEAAWRWRQLQDELDRRGSVKMSDLQQSITQLSDQAMTLTSKLIDRRAWAAQLRRTTVLQRGALVGWLQLQKRRGKGKTKREHLLRAAARKAMQTCRTAIPVWIMPLSRVVDSFSFADTEFDVVVIDEASQSDSMALVAWYLGKQVLVVGDDEQVTPDAVGQDLTKVENLIATHLHGIPNAALYDGRQSVYDLALRSFGSTVQLREHFRCVPDIIGFSNQLSYNWALKPLRDASFVTLKPHVVEVRVDGVSERRNVNEVEARTVASLILAACEQPEYGGDVSFGAISLVGEEQARVIEQLLMRHLPPEEYERRRIICGNPRQFQGDERDVMFLSMVDSPAERVLAMRATIPFKQRFNVAASRARDQMWLVHSLDLNRDLQAGDLRYRLIDYVRDPSAARRTIEQAETKSESEFERLVMRRLVLAGYKVIPQYRVGYYRIDMVVEGGGKQLAVECDGDKFHNLDNLQADMERQAILERLGKRFVRIRGSAFYRDPDSAMHDVFDMLERLDIPKEASPERAEGEPSELVQRVTERAREIRESWRDDGDFYTFAIKRPTAPSPTRSSAAALPSARPQPPLQARFGASPIDPPSAMDFVVDQGVSRLASGTPYSETSLRPGGRQVLMDPDYRQLLRQAILEVITAEGPVHPELLVERLRKAHDIGKAGSKIQENVATAIRYLEREGSLRRDLDGFLWAPVQELETFRYPTSDSARRDIEHIAPLELRHAILHVVEDRIFVRREDIPSAVARVFGFQRARKPSADLILAQVDQLLRATELRISGDSVTLPGDE